MTTPLNTHHLNQLSIAILYFLKKCRNIGARRRSVSKVVFLCHKEDKRHERRVGSFDLRARITRPERRKSPIVIILRIVNKAAKKAEYVLQKLSMASTTTLERNHSGAYRQSVHCKASAIS